MAGFSMATRLPAGSYTGQGDFYVRDFSILPFFSAPAADFVVCPSLQRDTVHSRGQSQSTLGFRPTTPSGFPGFPSQMSFGGGPGSIAGGGAYGAPSIRGSEFGYMGQPPTSYGGGFNPTLASQMSLAGAGGAPSILAGPPPMSAMPRRQSNMSAFSGFGAGFPGSASVYSMGAFATPQVSQSSSPTDDELVATLKVYLASQDLMQVCHSLFSLFRA